MKVTSPTEGRMRALRKNLNRGFTTASREDNGKSQGASTAPLNLQFKIQRHVLQHALRLNPNEKVDVKHVETYRNDAVRNSIAVCVQVVNVRDPVVVVIVIVLVQNTVSVAVLDDKRRIVKAILHRGLKVA